MKTLNLLQNMSAEAKVLAMALPMLLLSAMSAMAQDPAINQVHPFPGQKPQDAGLDYYLQGVINVPASPDSASVQPGENTAQDGRVIKLPGKKKPKSPGLDYYLQGVINVPASPDSANVEPGENTAQDRIEIKLPGQKPQDAPIQGARFASFPIPVSPDSANVEPAQQPNVNGIPPMPRINRGEPEQDGRYVPRIPGNEDVYESPYIKDYTTPSGIAEVAVDNQPSQAAQGVFTLSGLRVSESADLSGLAPGLYIVNGKKMLVR